MVRAIRHRCVSEQTRSPAALSDFHGVIGSLASLSDRHATLASAHGRLSWFTHNYVLAAPL